MAHRLLLEIKLFTLDIFCMLWLLIIEVLKLNSGPYAIFSHLIRPQHKTGQSDYRKSYISRGKPPGKTTQGKPESEDIRLGIDIVDTSLI